MEGAAVYKHNGYWYYFATYGSLVEDYTIRVGRSTNPRGPYYDKDGIDLNDNGGSLVFGDEGEQLVPGHPHVWEEDGQFYIGYDYRKYIKEETFDYMGIRKLQWIDDWPSIYQPITITFYSDDYPQAIGNNLGIRFRNSGEENSILAVDLVELSILDSE